MENNNYLTRSFRSWYACLMVSVLFLASTGTHAQTITNYAFSSDSLGTFTPISGGTNVPAVQADDANSASLPIGFTFYYMGLPYTSVSACSNGFIYLGTGSFNALTNDLTNSGGTSRPILAPLWDDENGAGALPAGVASYITTGSPGSRVFTFEWLNWRWYYTASVATISYQCKLYEATGAVQFVYRNDAASTPGSATIGISAFGTGSGNFLSLGSSGTNPSVSSTTETTTITGNPVSGQTYTFTPPQTPPAAPDSLYFTSVTTNSMTVGWKDNSTDETNFQVFISTDGINYTPASSLTSTSVATTGTLYSANLTGLFPGTTYYVQVFSNTEGVLSSALSGSQATVNVVPICGTFTVSNLLTTDIGLSQFASLADAASYLSQNGTCGALTLNVAAGHTETAPANGISFSFCSFPDSLRPGASSPLIIQKSGAGANPLITAFTPGVTTTVDGIFKLVGADYVTIDGIDLQENAANTTATAQMEWGYALLKCSGNDGSNYNTIKNCVVTLNKANTGSKAIYSGNHTAANTTALTYTGLAGTEDAARNGHNTFYGNTLQNTAYGINLNGNTALSPNGNNVSLNDTLN
ncbi:MAG: fibronectin type III domain-containing protein, partial [Bacteroidia bacterium]|nr:fibronectin type III domain-containing protein [Bacteroidia bacterium]